jgi:hypothetical protein
MTRAILVIDRIEFVCLAAPRVVPVVIRSHTEAHRMKRTLSCTLALALVSSMGCYHAVVNTGRAESSTIVEKQWASGWVFGLVPPDPLDVSKECAGGVAKVETQHSFLNMLVQFITIDIYTPMDIKVTCAGAGMAPKTSMLIVPSADTPEATREALAQAVQQSDKSGEPVFVRF